MALDAKVAGMAQALVAAQKWKKGLLEMLVELNVILMKQTNERSKVIEATEFDTVEFFELDGISTFRANNIQRMSGELFESEDMNGDTVRYLAYGSCSLLGTMDGLVTPIAHMVLFRERSDLTLFIRPEELDTFGVWISTTDQVAPTSTAETPPTIDLSFRANPKELEVLFDNLVNFRPELAIELEKEGRLVSWMSTTFDSIRELAAEFEKPPYNLGWQAWSEAMMVYLREGPQKEKRKVLSSKRKWQMWAVIMGID